MCYPQNYDITVARMFVLYSMRAPLGRCICSTVYVELGSSSILLNRENSRSSFVFNRENTVNSRCGYARRLNLDGDRHRISMSMYGCPITEKLAIMSRVCVCGFI